MFAKFVPTLKPAAKRKTMVVFPEIERGLS